MQGRGSCPRSHRNHAVSGFGRLRANFKATARADLPSDRRPSGQHFPHPGDGRGGGFRVRHVRHRRRLPDDAAVDLHRHRARGRGRLRRQPHRGVVVFRRAVLLAPPRHRSRAGAGAALRRHHRHRARGLDLHAAALARPARSDDRAVLRGAAEHGRRADVLGRPARAAARPPRHHGPDAPLRQPWLDPRPAAENALQALEDLSVGDPGHRRRHHHRLHRRHHGHRRRLHPGPDHDLSLAGADRDRDRHLDGADAGHHGCSPPCCTRSPTIWSTPCWR